MRFIRPFGVSLVAASLAVLAGSTRDASAQDQKAFEELLANAKKVKCTFPIHVRVDWKNGEPVVENITTEPLTLEFHDINTDEGTAQSATTFGPNFDIVVRQTYMALNFVQSMRSAGLYTTTIFARQSRAGRLRAVHTRHEYMDVNLAGFTSRPEQYYGDCEVTR
jgi:hypothetical protein